MMKKTRILTALFALFLTLCPLQAGERTIPVDFFVMIDKSLSMAEPGKFNTLHQWVRDQLIGQMLIDDDWITIYQFYGQSTNLLTLTVQTAEDRDRIVQTIDAIEPDGKYTDIGLALDTIQEALKRRGPNDRHKVMLLLTDLKQEAPWTSRYAGSPDKFESPYLAEARIVQHDAWYEITLDMDIQDRVVQSSRELFASIQKTRGTAAETGDTTGDNDLDSGESGTAEWISTGEKGTSGLQAEKTGPGLPFRIALVVVSGIVLAGGAAFTVTRIQRNKKEKEQNR